MSNKLQMSSDSIEIISVIVVLRNSGDVIFKCLDSVRTQTFSTQKIELIVVDGCSVDDSVAVVNDFFRQFSFCFYNCVLLTNPQKILASGWNIGIFNAIGQFTLRIDAHSRIANSYIGCALKFLIDNPSVSGVGGILKTLPRSSKLSSTAIAKLVSSKFGVGNSPFRREFFDGAFQSDTAVFALYRTSMFRDVGFFNEKLDRGQDIELHARAIDKGHQLWTCGRMQIYHFAPGSITLFLNKALQTGYWAVLGGRPRIRHIVPSIFVFYLLLLVISVFIILIFDCCTSLIVMISVPLVVYSSMLFYYSIFTIKLGRYFYLPFFFHFYYGLGGIKAAVNKLRLNLLRLYFWKN
jgi:GT2 family glycosyltransferase